MKNSKLIQVPPDGRRAEPGVPGDRGLRGPREPGDPGPAGGGHAPDAASLHAPRVPMPGSRQARPGDLQVSGPGRAPYADLSEPEHGQGDQHLSDPQHQGCPPPQVADGGLRGPPEEVKGVRDRGRAPDADIAVRETLSKTIVKVDISVDSGRSSVKSGDRYLHLNYETTDFVKFEDNGDTFELIYRFNQFCWQGAGGFKSPPLLPSNLSEVTATKTEYRSSNSDVVPFHFLSQAPVNLTDIEETVRYEQSSS